MRYKNFQPCYIFTTSFFLGLISILIVVTSGCGLRTHVIKGSESLENKAKQFFPSPGHAGLYILRPYQFVASGSPIPFVLDHKPYGSLPCHTFIYIEVLPSEHIIELGEYPGITFYDTRTGNTSDTRWYGTVPVSERFKAEDGKCYFYSAKASLSGFLLENLSVTEGQKMVLEFELSGDNLIDNNGKRPRNPL